MTAAEAAKELQSLLKKLRAEYPDIASAAAASKKPPADVQPASTPQPPTTIEPEEPLLGRLLVAFLHWESTAAKSAAALKKLESAVVDFNELRHCMPDELTKIIGERYPRAGERSLRLRSALAKIYAREHRMTLGSLNKLEPLAARDYLRAIEGVPPYVAAHVALHALGAHAAPVDSRIRRRLIEAKVIDDAVSEPAAAALLEKKLKPADLAEACALLQAWADDGAFSSAESHLDSVKTIVRPAVDKAAREKARKAAKRDAKRAGAALKPRKSKPAKPAKKKPGKRA